MKEDEILDTPNTTIKIKRNIWLIRLITIFILSFAILSPRIVYIVFPHPHPHMNIVFAAVSTAFFISVLGFIFFYKNIETKSTKLLTILFQCICMTFLGTILSAFLFNLTMHSTIFIFFTLKDYLETLLVSLLLGCSIPFGIYYWLDQKNNWLLPSIILAFLILIYFSSRI